MPNGTSQHGDDRLSVGDHVLMLMDADHKLVMIFKVVKHEIKRIL